MMAVLSELGVFRFGFFLLDLASRELKNIVSSPFPCRQIGHANIYWKIFTANAKQNPAVHLAGSTSGDMACSQ